MQQQQHRPIFTGRRPSTAASAAATSAAASSVLISRTPTQYVNVRQRQCPANCCPGDIINCGPTPQQGNSTSNKKPANFPVDPLKDSSYPQSQHQSLMNNDDFSQYFFNPFDNAGLASSTSFENDDFLERENDCCGSSRDSSTQSLLLWRHRQQQLKKKQTPAQQQCLPSASTNGAAFRLEQNSRYSTPWWSAQQNSPLVTTTGTVRAKRPPSSSACSSSSIGLRKNAVINTEKGHCRLFPWLVGLLLLLSIGLLFWTVVLIVRQQWALEQQLKDTQTPFRRLLKADVHRQNETSAQLMALFNGSRVRETLGWVASKVHVAGTAEQLELMEKLAEEYRSLGFDVRAYEYPEVLLSSAPDYGSANTVHAWNGRRLRWELISDGIGHGAKRKGKMDKELARQLEDDRRMHVWWNAYSRNGTALGELVYANYGTAEDFEELQKANISMAGRLLLIRYGGIFRGDKIHLAERNGAVGVLLYSDPFDYAAGNKTFPEDVWLPPTGSQRGTLYRGTGDPETPLLPSLAYVHRQFSEQQLRAQGKLPGIPVTSIGYEDARKLFERMDGPLVPWSRWAGSLPVAYRLSGSVLLRLDVNTGTERRRIRNFVAKMRGAEEPDRWVLLGNHADAWAKGSVDPATGTSTMLEMARVLAEYANTTGWRPRRTIVFCQWDAEEFGLIGSTEWVEENLRLLQARAVAYVNVDNFNGNTTLSVKSVPLLYRLIVEAASRVPQPVISELENGRNTLLDSWRFHNARTGIPGDRSVPFIQLPHSGSDFQPFVAYAGIPVADLRMENVPYSYMLYHTAYEVPWFNDHFLDPRGETSVALGRFWLEIVRQLADNMLIPFNVEDYATVLADYVTRADAQMNLLEIVTALGAEFYTEKLAHLHAALSKFIRTARQFQRLIQAVNSEERPISVLRREQLNGRLVGLERCFLLDRGLDEGARRQHRHAVFSAPAEEANSNSALPLLLDPAARWLQSNRSGDRYEAEQHLEKVRLAFAWLQYCVECASEALALTADNDDSGDDEFDL